MIERLVRLVSQWEEEKELARHGVPSHESFDRVYRRAIQIKDSTPTPMTARAIWEQARREEQERLR